MSEMMPDIAAGQSMSSDEALFPESNRFTSYKPSQMSALPFKVAAAQFLWQAGSGIEFR
jgi:hypothetical protein